MGLVDAIDVRKDLFSVYFRNPLELISGFSGLEVELIKLLHVLGHVLVRVGLLIVLDVPIKVLNGLAIDAEVGKDHSFAVHSLLVKLVYGL